MLGLVLGFLHWWERILKNVIVYLRTEHRKVRNWVMVTNATKGKPCPWRILHWVQTWEKNLKAYQTTICMPGKRWKKAMDEYQHRWEGDSWLAGNHAEWQLSSISTPDLASEPTGLCCGQVSGVGGRCGSAPEAVAGSPGACKPATLQGASQKTQHHQNAPLDSLKLN